MPTASGLLVGGGRRKQQQAGDGARYRAICQAAAPLWAGMGSTCNELFMIKSGAAEASRAFLLPLLLLQLRESCGSCQRCVFPSYPQKQRKSNKKDTWKRANKKSTQRKSERAGLGTRTGRAACSQIEGHKTAILAKFLKPPQEKPFLFRKKALMLGLPSRVNCQKKGNWKFNW